jgi:excisionase family DNA binding protein
MARRFNYRRVKIHRNYTIAELAARIGAHKQTISRWIAAGLPTTDSRRPFLIRGDEFRAFMRAREPSSSIANQASFTALAAERPNGQPAIWRTISRAPQLGAR